MERVALPLRRFLLLENCPPKWPRYDLYLFRDDAVVFYVGQSNDAFERVWEHLRSGFKGRSLVGRFVLCNWPHSLRFTVELLDSQASCFAQAGHGRDGAELALIQRYAPCFNDALNPYPTPLPGHYTSIAAPGRLPRSLRNMRLEAERAVQRDRNRQPWR